LLDGFHLTQASPEIFNFYKLFEHVFKTNVLMQVCLNKYNGLKIRIQQAMNINKAIKNQGRDGKSM